MRLMNAPTSPANGTTEETAMKLDEDAVEDQGHGDHGPKEESRDHNPNTADRKTHLERILEKDKEEIAAHKRVIECFNNMLHDAEDAVRIQKNSSCEQSGF
ncbi:hypothetical protein SI65_05023 [Aspergillus cristatus]|uniref:Uncharacterized protein n=1 Tax=Aspergillus cristatus TaxID=573508 RepID=A0A1E3BGJ6_ASPCR|nr:hypothetical protein SI65_05023 [Aspergillus cristatus]